MLTAAPGLGYTYRWQGAGEASDAFTAMHRAKFRLDGLLEPAANASGPRSNQWNELMAWVPPTLILRARKEGI